MKRCSLDPSGLPPSRKKACQACTNKKVKCNLQTPCAKCVARGDDCVYQSHRAADTGRGGEPSGEVADPMFGPINRPNLTPYMGCSPSAGGPLVSAGHFNPCSALSNADLMHPKAGHTSNPTPTPFGALMNNSTSCSSAQTVEHVSESYITSQREPPSNTGPFQSDLIIDVNSAFLDNSFNQPNISFPPKPGSMLQHPPFFIPRPLAFATEHIADPSASETDSYRTYMSWLV